MDQVEHDTFAPFIGDRFQFLGSEDGNTFEAVLHEVNVSPHSNPVSSRQGFDLFFHTAASHHARQQTYQLLHPQFDDLHLFITNCGPVNPTEHGLQAIVN